MLVGVCAMWTGMISEGECVASHPKLRRQCVRVEGGNATLAIAAPPGSGLVAFTVRSHTSGNASRVVANVGGLVMGFEFDDGKAAYFAVIGQNVTRGAVDFGSELTHQLMAVIGGSDAKVYVDGWAVAYAPDCRVGLGEMQLAAAGFVEIGEVTFDAAGRRWEVLVEGLLRLRPLERMRSLRARARELWDRDFRGEPDVPPLGTLPEPAAVDPRRLFAFPFVGWDEVERGRWTDERGEEDL